MKRVLWVEDGAVSDLPHMAAQVIADGSYDLVLAEDASDGLAAIAETRFDALVVDIRLPPGRTPFFVEKYSSARSIAEAKLGLELLDIAFGVKEAPGETFVTPEWLRPEIVGVLTVEAFDDVRDRLEQVGVAKFREKASDIGDAALLDLVRELAR